MGFDLVIGIILVALALGLWFLIPIPYLTPKPVVKEILRKIELKTGDKFYELGAGNGRVMILVAKNYPDIEIIGFEKSLIFYCLAWLNLKLNHVKNAKLYRQNFFKADLSQADAVFCYLFPTILEKLKDKFLKELKPDAKIVSFGFEIKDWSFESREFYPHTRKCHPLRVGVGVYKNKPAVYFYRKN